MTEYMVNGTPADAGRDAVAEVVIDGKVFPLTGGDTEYMQRVASYIDGKIAALRKTRQFSRQNAEYRTVMIWLNLADDYFSEKEAAEALRVDRDTREGEIYSLKRELVEKRLAAEDAGKKLAEALSRAGAAEKRAAEAEAKTILRGVIRHEFRHHLEFLSGIHDETSLEAQDKKEKRAYLLSHRKDGGGKEI